MVSSVSGSGAQAPFLNFGNAATGAGAPEAAPPIDNLQGTAAREKLKQALAQGADLEKTLAEQKGAVAAKQLEWLDRLMDNYLKVAQLAQQLGQPKLAAHLARQADQFLSRGPGIVADARAAIPNDGNAEEATLALHRRVEQIALKAQALVTAVAAAVRNAPETAGDDVQRHIGGVLASVKAMTTLAGKTADDSKTAADDKADAGDKKASAVSVTA